MNTSMSSSISNLAGKTRQTTNAHRLSLKAWLCGGEAAQTKMVSALFAAYFEKETDIGCYDFLSKAAESTGLMTAEHVNLFHSLLPYHAQRLLFYSLGSRVSHV
jgi:predicted DsbA family dithiol-disulfide isomerase